jgi:uncharacterized membrane protein YphA (DoxX/SURF4 family)
MNIALWIIQGILAAMFLMAGVSKSTQPIPKLVKTVTWADRFPVSTVRLIGILELLAAFGLILPWALQILPVVTPLAATGLVLIMLLAILHHSKHNESKAIGFNAALLLLAALVAFGRFTML